MSHKPKIRHYKKKLIRRIAEKILKKYYPTGTNPIDVEAIADSMNFDIDELDGLQEKGIKSIFSSDFRKIMVDKTISLTQPEAKRLVIAHQIGHAVLHQDFMKDKKNSVESWIHCCENMDGYSLSVMNANAQMFARMLLVPNSQLNNLLQTEIEAKGWDEGVKDYCKSLPETFKVSTKGILRRLKEDEIVQKYKKLRAEGRL